MADTPPLDIDLGARRQGSRRPGSRSTNRFFEIFGRTDLRIGVSGAKFHKEIDFDAENCRIDSFKNPGKIISKTPKKQFFFESFFRRFGGRQAS